MDKNCDICVYIDACEDRDVDESITDCCVPVGPLREKQKAILKSPLFDVATFMMITNSYINSVKRKSKYWTELEK